ncbi:MAG: hypothetical protein M1476_00550 [Candidatus Thermoplasmatota archaeon]|nr:hypothetical protein [Candidatus Thermoplasmatota archaeon]
MNNVNRGRATTSESFEPQNDYYGHTVNTQSLVSTSLKWHNIVSVYIFLLIYNRGGRGFSISLQFQR